jgi:5-methyltetrahydropteroyltriglutamate--homocysteine methyltransferase
MSMLFPTTLIGSYPQPDWLIDRKRLAGRFPPRVRALELWRVPEPYLKAMVAGAQIVRSQLQSERESSPTGAIL